MEIFLQQLINGLTLGSIYGLIAIGYTMVFGIIGMVNFAHGDLFMLSSFIGLIVFMALTQLLGLSSPAIAFLWRCSPPCFSHPCGTGRLSGWPIAPCAGRFGLRR